MRRLLVDDLHPKSADYDVFVRSAVIPSSGRDFRYVRFVKWPGR